LEVAWTLDLIAEATTDLGYFKRMRQSRSVEVGSIDEVLQNIRRLTSQGFYVIVNETISVTDGGVSGVVLGGVVEFAPEATPRCVESSDVASLPLALAQEMLSTVYGFKPKFDFSPESRVEFSIHPQKRGFRHEHTVMWELQRTNESPLSPAIRWPNEFSRFIGDKAYGLIVAHILGATVPQTFVLGRKARPFSFGTSAGTDVVWLRTCPKQPEPGKFATVRGWTDPFALMSGEDPDGTRIASLLLQQEVTPEFSGASLSAEPGVIVEGVVGTGDTLMLGNIGPGKIPDRVREDVVVVHWSVEQLLGPVRMEWVHDGQKAWVVQLQQERRMSSGTTIVSGKPSNEHAFEVKCGLKALRELIARIAGTGDGIVLHGSVGLTSHMADVLRREGIPSRVESEAGR
jgi:hypothetical protein